MNEEAKSRVKISTTAKAYILKSKVEAYIQNKNKLISRLIEHEMFFSSQFKYKLYRLVEDLNSTLIQFFRVHRALTKKHWIPHTEALNTCLTIAMTKASIKKG